MADGRKSNGGKRTGSGRKSRAELLGLAELIDSVWEIPRQKAVIKKLAQDAESEDFKVRHEARKLLLAYKFGQPTVRKELAHEGAKVIFGWDED